MAGLEFRNQYHVESKGSPPFRRHYIILDGHGPLMDSNCHESIHKICLLLNNAYQIGVRVGKATAKK
jgi:hypothetical protein